MRVFLQTLASLSLSGSLLILLLWALRPWLRGKISRRCQYLLWLAAALRLLLPFSPETNLMNWLFRLAEAPAQAAEEVLPAKPPQADQIGPLDLPPSLRFPGYLYARETAEKPASQAPAAPVPAVSNASSPWKKAAPMGLTALWLAGFIIAAGRRLWAYRRFCRQTAARLIPPDPAALEIAERLRRQLSIRYPLPLWALPGAASPFLAWLGRPCVLLPAAAFAPEQLKAALLHELTHYKRRDLASKALLQLVLCVHWFNPLVYRLVRLAQQDCELACDEGVLARLDPAQRLAYGDALLDFSLFSISYPAPAAPLGADGLLLKERLEAVARFRPNDKRRLLQGAACSRAPPPWPPAPTPGRKRQNRRPSRPRRRPTPLRRPRFFMKTTICSPFPPVPSRSRRKKSSSEPAICWSLPRAANSGATTPAWSTGWTRPWPANRYRRRCWNR